MNFQEKLKAIYRKQNKIAPLIEGFEEEIPQQTLDDNYYVKLKVIIKQDDDKKQGNYEKISGKKQEVEIANIFDQNSNKTEPRRLLILGGAGVGKSTMMQYMAYRWSKGNLWTEKFDYVYRITLKTLLNDEWKENYEVKDLKADILKCLAHYHLTAAYESSEKIKLEEMIWLEKKDKVLLLLDDYDEVAHERNGVYKDVFTQIFQHENLILTSRPNAVHKEMAEKFSREIENTGLNRDGINQYLTQYFKNDKQKGIELQEFLRKNSYIKDICRIPVNIGMMCFIWSQGEANETEQKISNVSDLYSQVVNQLGFRFDTKQNQQNTDELISKWRGGEIYLDELQVLQHVAFQGMTGGGFDVPEEKRSETLIIKGATKKNDNSGISIQSSILHLKEKLKRDMPAISRVYKYGLLKLDSSVLKFQSEIRKTKKELSDTDLLAQNFSFIHLSFQEFLAASYLVKKLLTEEDNKEEQEKLGNFIAHHRNEPRYLTMVKFMAGILSSSQEEEAQEKINIFWDAVFCNPDGTLELGIEGKVTLLMHLIGQTRNETRVPNMTLAVDFIDSVVLKDISRWSTEIKESDYMSENMKEGLIEYFLKDNKEWLEKKYQEMQIKFTKRSDNSTHSVNKEEIIEIIVSMIHKFSKEQQIQIFQKLFKLFQAESNWQVLKRMIEGIMTIQEKVEINLNNIEKRKVLDALKKTVHDSNLGKTSIKAIQQVLDDPDDALFVEVIKAMVEEAPKDVNGAGVYQTVLDGVIQIAQRNLRDKDNHEVLKEIVNVFVPLLSSSQEFVREAVAATMVELIELLGASEKEFVRGIVGAYISLWQSLPKEKGFAQTNIVKLAKISKEFIHDTIKSLDSFLRGNSEAKMKKRAIDTMIEVLRLKKASEFLRDILVDMLIPLLNETDDENVRLVISSQIPQLVRIADGNDPQLARDIIGILLPLLQDNNLKDTIATMIQDLAIIRDRKDQEFIRELIKTFLLLLKDEYKTNISERIVGLIKASDITDSRFLLDIIIQIAPSLKSSSDTTRLFEAEKIVWLMERGGITNPQLVKDIDIVNLAVLVSPDIHVEYLIRTAKVVAEAMRVAEINDAEFAKEIIKSVIGCLKDWSNDARRVIINPLFGLMKILGIINDTQIVKDFITIVVSYFESFDEITYKDLGELITVSGAIKDTRFVFNVLVSLASLMQKNRLTALISRSFEEFVRKLDEEGDIELAREMIKVLAEILTFPIIVFQPSAEKLMIEIFQRRVASDPSFLQEVVIALAPVFEDSHEGILGFGLNIIQEILKIKGAAIDNKLIQDCIDVLTPVFMAPVTEAKLSALEIIEKLLLKNCSLDDKIIMNLIEALIGNIGDKNQVLRKLVSKIILNLAKTPQLAIHTITSSVVLKDTSQIELFTNFLGELVKVSSANESIDELSKLTKPPHNIDIKRSASQRIFELVRLSKKEKDVEFCKSVLDQAWVPSLHDVDDENMQLLSLDFISKVVELNGSEKLVKHVTFELALLLQKEDTKQKTRNSVFTHLINFSKKGDVKLAHDMLKNTLVPLFEVTEEENWRSLVLKNIRDLAIGMNSIDVEIVKSLMPIIFSLLKSKIYSTLFSASTTIIDLIKISPDVQYICHLVTDLVPLMQEISGDDFKCCLLDTIGMLVKIIETPDLDFLRKVILDILIPYLHDDDLKSSAASWIPEIVTIAAKSDTQITRDFVRILLPLLKDDKVKHSVSVAIYKIIVKHEAKDEQYVREIIDTFFINLKNDQQMLDVNTSANIIDIIKVSGIKDPQFIQDVITNFAPSLKSSGDTTRFTEAEKIVWLMERGGIRDAQLVRDIVNLAVLVPPTIHVEYLIKTSQVVAEAIKVAKITDAELGKDVAKIVVGCLKDWFNDARSPLIGSIFELVKGKSIVKDTQFVKEFIEKLVSLFGSFQRKLISETVRNIVELMKLTGILAETEFVITSIDTIFSFFKGRGEHQEAVQEVMELFINGEEQTEITQAIFNNMIKLLSDCYDESKGETLSSCIIEITQRLVKKDPNFMKDILKALVPILKEPNLSQPFSLLIIDEFIKLNILTEKDLESGVIEAISSVSKSQRKRAEEILEKLLNICGPINDDALFKTLIKHITAALDATESEGTSLIFTLMTIHARDNVKRIRQFVNALASLFHTPHFSMKRLFILPALEANIISFLEYPNFLTEYLGHSVKELRDVTNSTLLECFESYQLQASTVGHIKSLEVTQIIGLALTIIGKTSLSKEEEEGQKLVELARETLMIQLKHLTEKDLTWINENHEWLVSLSSETKLFYKKIYRKLLEDSQVSSLVEELIIKFISQGLTTSLTREGEMIFEGKRHKLQGKNIEFAVEGIAKTMINQKQDILALQYKDHEPIFKKKSTGGMKEAAADKEEVQSLVNSRHVLQNNFWLLTRLKSLKFKSEIAILEQRSAFGDHIIYHLKQQQLYRIYPGEIRVFDEIFGSYIYGEVYQGETQEIDDKAGVDLINETKNMGEIKGKVKSQQIYFQEELLRRENQDRNDAIEEELAKKLDNNRALLQSKLKELNMKKSEMASLEDYYEGFTLAFSATFTSSKAIVSGKLWSDDGGGDFFSPVNLFIKICSLAPFGIVDVVSGGLEATRSHIKRGTKINNEAKFIQEIATDAVELSELVIKVALEIVSKNEQREKIIKEKNSAGESKSLVYKIKNLVLEKLEKFKNTNERYTKMKNFFEKEIEASSAFRLGENDANKIMKHWIEMKASQLDLKLTLEEKQKKFVKMIISDGTDGFSEGRKSRLSVGSPSSVVVVNTSESRASGISPNKKHLIPIKEGRATCHCQIF